MDKKNSTVTREESDILVAIGKLETKFDAMSTDLGGARMEIKEINTGITSRLLNLESNTVMKLQFHQLEGKVDAHDILINELIKSRAVWRGQIQIWVILGGAVWTVLLLLATKYFYI